MAYAATVTRTHKGPVAGRTVYVITIVETEAADTSEATIPDVPRNGRIMDVTATLASGTGTTIDTEIGRAAGWADSGQDQVWQNGVASAHVDAQPGKPYFSATGTLYMRSSPNNAAANHTITTQVVIVEGPGA
jgi:hypothetical protein